MCERTYAMDGSEETRMCNQGPRAHVHPTKTPVVKTGHPMLLKLCEAVLSEWEGTRHDAEIPMDDWEPESVTLARAYMVEVMSEA